MCFLPFGRNQFLLQMLTYVLVGNPALIRCIKQLSGLSTFVLQQKQTEHD